MDFQERMKSFVNGNKIHSPEKIFDNANFVCVNEFKWSYDELMKTPIPFVTKMINKFQECKKAELNASKRRRR